MDPSVYNAAMNGNMEDGDFSLAEHLRSEEENGKYQVTPNGNTILHVATLFGRQGFVGGVLNITPRLLRYKNKKNETALHIAANIGQSEMVSELLSIRGEKAVLVRMTDDVGDTALHKAVRGGHLDIVKILVNLLLDPELDLLVDPELDFPANKAGETPLYLAAESDFHDALIEILNVCKEPIYVAGPSNLTPLHVALIHGHRECTRSLWQWNKHLCEKADEWGWNSLHYAVKLGLKNLVSDMLEWKKSLAYLQAGSENDWTTAFHIAASEGDVDMINELLKHCPDCWDMVNSKGQNALHVAILNHRDKLVDVLLKLTSCNNLVDEADNEGNTPLHLMATYWSTPRHFYAAYWKSWSQLILDYPRAMKMYWKSLPQLILYYSRAMNMASNKQNQTTLHIAFSRNWAISKAMLVIKLGSINGRLGQRNFKVKEKTETLTGKIRQMRRNENNEKTKEDKISRVKDIMKATQIGVVLATLLMTVTFTAAFTLPGGLESNEGPNKGMAILLKKAAFRAFVISDVLAFACSASAIFIYFFMAILNNIHIGNQEITIWCQFMERSSAIAGTLQILAMGAVVVAFVTGMYATLENSLPLAVSVCVIGCVSFLCTYYDIGFQLMKL